VPYGQVLAMLSRSCVLVKREGAEAIHVKINRVRSWLTRYRSKTAQRSRTALAPVVQRGS
jgi:hypothetical protein